MGNSPKDFRGAKANRGAAANMAPASFKDAKASVAVNHEEKRGAATHNFNSPSNVRNSMKQSFGNRAMDAKDQKWRFKEPNRNGNLVKGQKQGFIGSASNSIGKVSTSSASKNAHKTAIAKEKHANSMEEKRTSTMEKHKSPSSMKNAMKNSFKNRAVDAKDQKWRLKDANRNGQLVKGQKHGFDRNSLHSQMKSAPAKKPTNGIDMEMIDDMKSWANAKQPHISEAKRINTAAKHKSPSKMRASMKKIFGNRHVDAKEQKYRMKEPNREGKLVKGQKHGFKRTTAKAKSK